MPVELEADVDALDVEPVVVLDDDTDVELELELGAPPVPDAVVVCEVVSVVEGPCDPVVPDADEPVVAPPRPVEFRAQELPDVIEPPTTKRSAKRPFIVLAYRSSSKVA